MKIIKNSITISLVTMVLCGFIYPMIMTGISQFALNKKANGSIIIIDGKKVGSELIGQSFTDPKYFRGRVSAINYNTFAEKDTKPDKEGKTAIKKVSSGSQNLSPSSKALCERIEKDIEEFLKSHTGVKREDIPADLFTSSGSGLDPNISPESAKIQIPAVSKASGISESKLQDIVDKYTEGKSLGIFGQERVNVLKVNLEIHSILKSK